MPPYKMASGMGLETLQNSRCYKMVKSLKVGSYNMALEIGLDASHVIGEICMRTVLVAPALLA